MQPTVGSMAISFVLIAFLSYVWRVVNWVWLKPKKLEKLLREQGLDGNPYRLLHGDTRDMTKMTIEARGKPINLSDDITPRILPFYHHIIQKYGKNSFTWSGPTPRVNIMDPEVINEVLLNNTTIRKPTPNPLMRFLLSGLVSHEGDKWVKHRKILTPAFYLEKLKHMLPAMHLSYSELVNKWEVLVSEKGSCELDVLPYLQEVTSEVISRTAFGSSYHEGRRIFQLQKEQAALVGGLVFKFYIPGWRFVPTKRNKRMKEIDKEVQALIKGIVKERERAMQSGENTRDDDLLGMLLKSNLEEIKENGNKKDAGMSFEDVVEECKLFYFSGQETTEILLAWTMILLSMHPSWQAKAREEVCQVFGENKPDYNGISHLKIVSMILNEVLRLYPPLYYIPRVTQKETKIGKLNLPAGTFLNLLIIFVHHDREIWGEDVKEFKPERFSEGVAKATKNQVSFFPFGWGPRTCIGNNFALTEAKMALAMILQRFSFELSPSYTHAPTVAFTVQPQYGAHLVLHKL